MQVNKYFEQKLIVKQQTLPMEIQLKLKPICGNFVNHSLQVKETEI